MQSAYENFWSEIISSKSMCDRNSYRKKKKDVSWKLNSIANSTPIIWCQDAMIIWIDQKDITEAMQKLSAILLYLLIKWGWWLSDDYLRNGLRDFYQTS